MKWMDCSKKVKFFSSPIVRLPVKSCKTKTSLPELMANSTTSGRKLKLS